MKIAFIGTRGVPAHYGGFETAVEEVGSRLAASGHDIHVYSRDMTTKLRTFRGMTLHHMPAVRRKVLETLSHSAISALHAGWMLRPDFAFIFNVANVPFAMALRSARVPSAIHVDGLEWQRAKWSGWGARYFRMAERLATRSTVPIIADARAIQQYLLDRYGRESVHIAYGAYPASLRQGHLDALQLRTRRYFLVVARFEPENHVLEIVAAYSRASGCTWPMIVVGDAPYSSDYVAKIRQVARVGTGVRLVGAIWDQEMLDSLYAGAGAYIHGHSVGGTNPSLLRASAAGAPVIAHDNVFNREVCAGGAEYFGDESELIGLLEAYEAHVAEREKVASLTRDVVLKSYDWDRVAKQYEELAQSLAKGSRLRNWPPR